MKTINFQEFLRQNRENEPKNTDYNEKLDILMDKIEVPVHASAIIFNCYMAVAVLPKMVQSYFF